MQGFKQSVLKEYSAFIFRVSGCPLLDPEDEPRYFETPVTTYAIKHSITSQHVSTAFNHQETLLRVKYSYRVTICALKSYSFKK
jgi:hypothetical protein